MKNPEKHDPRAKIVPQATLMNKKKSFMPPTTTNRLIHDCKNSERKSLRWNKTEMTIEALLTVPFVKSDEDDKKAFEMEEA